MWCCKSCTFCARAFPKERNKSRGSSLSNIRETQIKICETCFLCHSLVLCPTCNKCPTCCTNSACRGQTTTLLANLAGSRSRSESYPDSERGLHPPKTYKVSHSHKLLCQSSQGQQSVGGITSTYRQKRSGTGAKPKIRRVFQPTLPGTKTQQQMETHIGPKQTKCLSQGGEIQNGNTRNHQSFSPPGGMGHLHRFQGHLLPHTKTRQEHSRKYLRFHFRNQTYQFKALPFGLSTAPLEFTVIAKEVKLMATHKGIRIHQYLDDWLVRARSHQACLQHTQTLVQMCQDLGWMVNLDKSELQPKQIFDFVGYQFDLTVGRVRPTPDRWQSLQDTITRILSSPACPVRQFMSLIGLLTATEKLVHLGRLHMRPIQWHLKNNWQVPESLEKVIPIPRSLHPHLRWWLQEDNVLTGQPLHPIKHALQIFTDASKEGWGAHLNECTERGLWSLPESNLHINYLELKAVLLALKEFRDLCSGQIVLVATDNTTVVSYINKDGGMRSGPLCALLWRMLTWCTTHQVTLKARHIPGRLNVVADKLSRLGQIIQTAWPLLQEIFQAICDRWHRPNIDLFATRFNNKLPQFVSPVPDTLAVAVDALSLQWEGMDAYAFPPAAILGKVVEKLRDSHCKRIILIAPGWPNMPWFWDLVTMSSQIPLSLPNLPNLLTQPFNQIPHRNLTNLNLHARGSTRSVYGAKWTIFTKWCNTNQVDFKAPPLKSIADFLMYLFEDSPAPLMVTDRPLLINWEVQPSVSAKMKISLVSWRVSIETDPRAEGVSRLGTYLWSYTS